MSFCFLYLPDPSPYPRANLNQSYFTNRQDRYIHFSGQPSLAQYCFDFLQTISTFSYRLLPGDSDLGTHSYRHEGYTLRWPDPQTHPHHIHQKAEIALSTFQTSQRATYDAHYLSDPTSGTTTLATQKQDVFSSGFDDVIIFPIIQAGQFNIREEETTLALLFRHLQLKQDSNANPAKPSKPSDSRPVVDLTSGYFGLYQPYQDLVLANDVDTRIVAASPKVC